MAIVIRFSHQKIEVETWAPKKDIKKKKDNSFISSSIAPINFTKNLHQTPAFKNRGKYQEQAKSDKIEKMGSKKIKENHNREKPKKMKETAKRNKKGDQAPPSEKKNIKCQNKDHENSKGY